MVQLKINFVLGEKELWITLTFYLDDYILVGDNGISGASSFTEFIKIHSNGTMVCNVEVFCETR